MMVLNANAPVAGLFTLLVALYYLGVLSVLIYTFSLNYISFFSGASVKWSSNYAHIHTYPAGDMM